MSVIDDIRAGLKMAPAALKNVGDNIYSIGVAGNGKTHTPKFLQKIGCVSVFAVPIVGGGN